VTEERLLAAYRSLNRRAAPGMDNETWAEFGVQAGARVKELHDQVHRGTYIPVPSRRVYIPKPDGRQRALGIASVSDKVVQQAVVDVLNAIYEEEFLGFSYGFRPKRDAHQALNALIVGIERRNVNWVLDADIKGFFDSIDPACLMACLEHRIGDKRMLRLIQKWLRAGVMEHGELTVSEKGTPQGATISPLLANVYLHYAFDQWAHAWRKTQARGSVVIVRYADDFVVGFEHRDDAERFHAALKERLAEFKLELHPEKTRLIAFGRKATNDHRTGRGGRPGTYNFLGFTHFGTHTRKGRFLIQRRTIARKMAATLAEIKAELKRRCNDSIASVGRWLRSVVQGYYQYFAVPTNILSLRTFRGQVRWLWWRALRRRSQRSHITAKRMDALADQFLPRPRILKPWPNQAFDRQHPR
jgi:group II intron reverse transcriptase/maturase